MPLPAKSVISGRLSQLLKPSALKVGLFFLLLSLLLFRSFGTAKPQFLVALDNQVFDAMFRVRGPMPHTGSVVIVDIDEKSLAGEGQWPWPRSILAKLVRSLHTAGARSIGFDMVFAEEDRTSPSGYLKSLSDLAPEMVEEIDLSVLEDDRFNFDLDLGNAVAVTPTVLGYVFQTARDGLKTPGQTPFPSADLTLDGSGTEFGELALFDAYRAILNVPDVAQAPTEGFINVIPDASGTVRKVPLFMKMDGVPYPSLAFEVLRLGLGQEQVVLHPGTQLLSGQRGLIGISLGPHFVPTNDRGQVTVNYRGPAHTFSYISALDVLENRDLSRVRDKYIIVGTSAAGLHDLRATPFGAAVPGVEVHASIIDNILTGDLFTYDVYTEIGLTYAVILAGGILMVLLLSYASPAIGGLGGALLVAGTILGNYQFFFLRNQLLGPTYPLLAIVAVFLCVTLFNYFSEAREKKFIRGAFSHYVSPQVVNQLIRSPDLLSLAGEERELSILFSDVRGFTSISERMNPRQLGLFMNEFLSTMSDTIMENRGTVDKFIGDAIMAIWGAPLVHADHASNAVRAALAMVRHIERLQPEWRQRGLPPIEIGVGINTGLVSVGNFGSRTRFNYTVIGDNVNLASRLEGLNKLYGTRVIISEQTRQSASGFFCRQIDTLRVKGKLQPVRIFEPLVEGMPEPELAEEVETHHRAIELYLSRRFEESAELFEKLQKRSPLKLYDVYLARISAFRANPPTTEWDGVFTAMTK